MSGSITLTLKKGKAIIIGGTMRVELGVIQEKQDQVRLRFSGPMTVDREELHLRKLAEGAINQAGDFGPDIGSDGEIWR